VVGMNGGGVFDRFAAAVGKQVSRAWFFTACVISILVWAATGPIFGFNETWQLVVNTGTTIVTFLLVALLQNTQERSTKALHSKLDAIATAVAYILEDTGATDGNRDSDDCVVELRRLVGVEMEAST
jgi:low affinity Fe/Cu permease